MQVSASFNLYKTMKSLFFKWCFRNASLYLSNCPQGVLQICMVCVRLWHAQLPTPSVGADHGLAFVNFSVPNTCTCPNVGLNFDYTFDECQSCAQKRVPSIQTNKPKADLPQFLNIALHSIFGILAESVIRISPTKVFGILKFPMMPL